MRADFSYMIGTDGFTSIFPDTPEAECEYNRIFAEAEGSRLTPWEFDEFRQNAHAAGYSVREHKPVNTEISVGELARLLEHERPSIV